MPRRALRRRAGEVDEDFVAGDAHGAANQDRFFKAIAPGFARPLAGGQLGDLGAHGGFRAADDFLAKLASMESRPNSSIISSSARPPASLLAVWA